jgi:hypothetical protein
VLIWACSRMRIPGGVRRDYLLLLARVMSIDASHIVL